MVETTRLPARLAILARYAVIGGVYIVGVFWALLWLIRQPFEILKNPGSYFTVKKRQTLPVILQHPALGEHGYLHLTNGIRIHYVASGNEAQPLMLLLHGFPDFWFSWRHQIKHFSDRYRVMAVDLRGYGDSSKPTAENAYALQKLAEDVKLILESLERKSCILVGHDWGGLIAWACATQYPDLIEKLIILNAPHPQVFWKFMFKSPKQFLMSWYIFLFQLPFLPEFMLRVKDLEFLEAALTQPPMGMRSGTMTSAELEAYKYTFSSLKSLTPPINYYRNIFRLKQEKSIRWRSVSCPVLIVFGAADHALSSELALLSGRYAAAQFQLKYLEGVSHWVHVEAPDDVNRTIDQFLTSKL